jgi:hypothetical protein
MDFLRGCQLKFLKKTSLLNNHYKTNENVKTRQSPGERQETQSVSPIKALVAQSGDVIRAIVAPEGRGCSRHHKGAENGKRDRKY